MREAAHHLVEDHHLPGLAIGVVHAGETIFAGGFGYADIEAKTPTDPAMRHRIASVSKTMVGLCVMALVDEGRLRVEDRVVDHLPDMHFDGPGEQITIWNLMTHTSGIGETPTLETLRKYGMDPSFDEGEIMRVPNSYPEGIVVETAPGALWAYANHAFVLLGEIVARTEGKPIEIVLQDRIFSPLGMSDSDCLDQHHPRLTTPYHREMNEDTKELVLRAGGTIKDEPAPSDGYNIRGKFTRMDLAAAGAVQSTVPDMCTYAAALLRGSGGIVRPETWQRMIRPQYCPNDKFYSMGLTFFRKNRWGYDSIGHGGSMFGGWNSQLIVFPNDDLAFIAHANIQWDDTYAIMFRVLKALLDAKDAQPTGAAIPQTILESAPGVYEATGGPLTNFRISTSRGRIQITREGDRLRLRARRGLWKRGALMLPASKTDPGYFRLEIDSIVPQHVALELDSRGAVTGLRFDDFALLRRNPNIEPWA
jgi:CubicO group peptidase (beta-lactamase class C family)